MEKRFCGKCGRLVSECVCGDQPVNPVVNEPATRAGERYEDIALAKGEVVVRSYSIGKYSKFFGLGGKGKATLIITNRRVLCKSEMKRGSSKANIVEELAMNEVVGVKSYYAGGLNVRRLIIGIMAVIATIAGVAGAMEETAMLAISIAALPIAVWMFFTMRKSRYLFGIHTRATSVMMSMGAKSGGRRSRSVSGISFEYEPTPEVQNMMNEIGACVMDLKTRGSAAVSDWKQA